jgi:enoyl-CoA hydratase
MTVHLVRSAAVGTLVVDRPPVNAYSTDTYRSLRRGLLELTTGENPVRALVVTAAGDRVFSAGTDLADFETDSSTEDVTAEAFEWFRSLAESPVPVVGALNGPAVGAGAMLASECDVLVAAEHCYFAMPEVASGFPGGGSHIRRLAPHFVAQRMMLLGEKLTAQRALELGTLAEVVPVGQAREAGERIASRLAGLPAAAVQSARRVFRHDTSHAAVEGYGEELTDLKRLLGERRTRRAIS